MGVRLVVNGEFQHHGILGQKWGVITKNVGVNYIPIGNRSSSVKGTAKRILKGVANGATSASKAVAGAGKAIAKGAKTAKTEHDAKVAEKQRSAYRNSKPLTRKEISRMSDQEVQNAINRRQKEQQLYEMEHPQIKAGKEFFSKYVADTLMSLGGDYAKKLFKMKADESIRKFIKENNHYSEAQKRDLLKRLDIETLSDTMARQAYESKIKDANENKNEIANILDKVSHEKEKTKAINEAINSLYTSEEDRQNARIRNGVATLDDLVAKQERETTIRNRGNYNSIRSMVSPDEYTDADVMTRVTGLKKPKEG